MSQFPIGGPWHQRPPFPPRWPVPGREGPIFDGPPLNDDGTRPIPRRPGGPMQRTGPYVPPPGMPIPGGPGDPRTNPRAGGIPEPMGERMLAPVEGPPLVANTPLARRPMWTPPPLPPTPYPVPPNQVGAARSPRVLPPEFGMALRQYLMNRRV
mgnify:CR=1 FL=1